MMDEIEIIDYTKLSNKELIDELVEQDKLMKDIKSEAEAIKAVLQARGIALLEDRNIKNTEWFGSGSNNVMVTKAQSMEIMNYPALEAAFGQKLLEDKITRKVETKYEIETSFKQALISIFCDDYIKDMTLDEMLKKEFPELEQKQIVLLLKKLKGDYKKDKVTLKAMVSREDIDEELFFINQIKNYDKIRAYIEDARANEIIAAVKKCIIVDDTAKIAVKYDKEADTEKEGA